MDMLNTTSYRSGERGQPIPERSSRFFEQEGYWYFRTREGMDIGPFDTQADAQEGVDGFVGFLRQAHADVVTRITNYINYQHRSGEVGNIPERSDRIFNQGEYWYFRTREGMDIGPFDHRGDAALGVKGFIGFLTDSEPDIVDRVTSYIRAA